MKIVRAAEFVLALASVAAAQTATLHTTNATDVKKQLDAIFAPYNRSAGPGCAVGVRANGIDPLTGAYGSADLEHNVPNTPETVFEAGSVTKQFTAAAVLLLAQRGKLSLDDDIRRYFPELPDYGSPIRISDLLYHTSGLRDWGEIEAIAGWPRGTRVYTHAHVLDILSRQRALNYPVGTAWSYTNSGYNLAAMLVEKVSGKTINEFTRAEFFLPLGMNSTQWRDEFRRVVPNRAIAYSRGPGGFLMDMPFEDIYGNGGLLTTVGDLLKWNQNQEDGKIGGRALIEAQQKQAALRDGKPLGYAAGLFIGTWRGRKEISHSGATAGYRAWLARVPEEHLSVAVLCNDASANTTQLGHSVAALFVDPDRDSSDTLSVPPVDAKARAGLYRSIRDHTTISIEERDGQLRIGHTLVLEPLPRGLFKAGDATVSFEADSTGKVERMAMSNPVYGRDVWEKVDPAHPSAAQLQELTGDYTSGEAEVTFQIKLENGALVLHRRPAAAVSLRPTYKDAFECDLGAVRFLRDASGTVTGLSVGEGRVWDLRFTRTN
jgi:CubicO group peptidase (beta-lactamase class C family)